MSDGEYDMGPLGLNLWLDFNIILDKKVHPSSFIPQPKVNSRLIIMEPVNREETKELDINLFRLITKHYMVHGLEHLDFFSLCHPQ